MSPDAQQRLALAAVPEDDGLLGAIHVTEDPGAVIELLDSGKSLGLLKPWLGHCGGLVVSAVPQLYQRGSERRWAFLEDLSQDEREQLAAHLLGEARGKRKSGYITESEAEVVERDIYHWLREGSSVFLQSIAGQPYNIDAPLKAKALGIGRPEEPDGVPVLFEGRYLDVSNHFLRDGVLIDKTAEAMGMSREMTDEQDICFYLKEAWGYDGMFTRAALVEYPGLTIWNGHRVLRYKDWVRE